MIKRGFDIFFSSIGIFFLFPAFLFISLFIVIESRGGIFFSQKRVGRDNRDFFLLKFRTMKTGSEKGSQLTIGSRDPRITNVGYFLRKNKLDELPQLINVFLGDMSFVGPRPEVRKYVDLYTPEQKRILSLKPGITDYSSIFYSDESELLSKAANPEEFYISRVMPEKIKMSLKYLENGGIGADFKIIFLTILKILRIK